MIMPRRPISRKVVSRLKEFVRAQEHLSREKGLDESTLTDSSLKELPNIDHRRTSHHANPNDFESWGGRVRLLRTNDRHNPDVAIKRVHFDPRTLNDEIALRFNTESEIVVQRLKSMVVEHNKKYGSDYYRLYDPKIYVVGKTVVLMSLLNKPNIREITDGESQRGIAIRKELIKSGQYDEFLKIRRLLRERLGFDDGNLVYLGFKKGKHEFVPLADLW